MAKVINLFGAPCAGKSVLATDLYSLMKKQYMSVELVTEYAKDLHYEGHTSESLDPITVFAEQYRRVNRLEGKVEYIITDSPLLLSAYYATLINYPREFTDLVKVISGKFHNENFYVTRKDHRYDPNGRSQDEAGANKIHEDLTKFLYRVCDIRFTPVTSGVTLHKETPQYVLDCILRGEQYANKTTTD